MEQTITRRVSGTASISIPTDWERFREVYLYLDVVRQPSNLYVNRNWAPDKTLYAQITTMAKDKYVSRQFSMEYESQVFTLYRYQDNQIFLAQVCALEAILVSIVNLSVAIPDTFPINYTNPLEDFTYPAIDFDRCVIKCYADTALNITLVGVPLEQCKETDGTPQPPPPPGTEDEEFDQGEPITITPPQENEPPEFNEPFEGDEEEGELEFPFGEECEKYLCTSAITTQSSGREVRSEVVYGPIRNFFYNPSGGPDGNTRDAIILECRELAEFNGFPLPCGNEVSYVWQDADPADFISAEIINVVPVD